MKQRRLGLLAGVSMLGLLAIGCGGAAASPRGWAEPVQSGDTTMISTGRGRIDGIKSDSAAWRFPNNWHIENGDARRLRGVYGSPVVSADGDTVFVADYNGFVYAFKKSEALTANQVESNFPKPAASTLNLGDPVIGGLVLDSDGGDLFVTAGPRVLRLGYADGSFTVKWTFKTGADIWSEPFLENGRVLVSSLDGSLYALDKNTGAVSWNYRAGDSGMVTTPLIINGVGFVGGFDNKLHAIDMATGEQKWTFSASYWIWNQPIVDSSRLIFGDFNGRLYAVNVADGSEAWSLNLEKGAIVGSPIISNGTLVVATEEGWLTGLDPSSQAIKWQVNVNSSITASLSKAADGTVLFAPSGCVTPEGIEDKTYYYGINPATGELRQAQGVC